MCSMSRVMRGTEYQLCRSAIVCSGRGNDGAVGQDAKLGASTLAPGPLGGMKPAVSDTTRTTMTHGHGARSPSGHSMAPV